MLQRITQGFLKDNKILSWNTATRTEHFYTWCKLEKELEDEIDQQKIKVLEKHINGHKKQLERPKDEIHFKINVVGFCVSKKAEELENGTICVAFPKQSNSLRGQYFNREIPMV